LAFISASTTRSLPHAFPTRRSSDLVEMAHDHDHSESGRLSEGDWARLAVNDHESGTVQVIDLASGEVVATFDLSARATLYTSEKDRKSTRLNSSHVKISYAVFCLKK